MNNSDETHQKFVHIQDQWFAEVRGKRLSQPEADQIWNQIRAAIVKIQISKDFRELSYENLYLLGHRLVAHDFGPMLYEQVKAVVSEHMDKVRLDMTRAIYDGFLPKLMIAWDHHKEATSSIRDILMYMDRSFIPKTKLYNVYNLGIVLFRDRVIRDHRIRDHLKKTMLDLIAKERAGNSIDRAHIRSACHMLLSLGIVEGGEVTRFVYAEDFESDFLDSSRMFYKIEGQKLLECSSTEYVAKVQKRIEEEKDRATFCLNVATRPAIIKVVEEELITANMKALVDKLDSGVVALIKQKRFDDLRQMYLLFKLVDGGVQTIIDVLSDHLRSIGKNLVIEPEGKPADPIIFIQSLLDLKDQFDDFLSKSFDKDKEILKTISKDFEHFINLNKKSPEYLSCFIDQKLRNSKDQSDQAFEETLEKSIVLFRFVQEKDIFEKYYKIHLSKRLLLQKPSSEDNERSVISHLKMECGSQFTSRPEGMFKDIKLSVTVTEEFKTFVISQKLDVAGVDLSVKLLTNGFWPIPGGTIADNIPFAPLRAFNVFKTFYQAKHCRRQLTLQHHLGFAEVIAWFYGPKSEDASGGQPLGDAKSSGIAVRPRRYMLNLSTHQMCIMMLFNHRDRLTFEQIAQETEIPECDLIRALQSLAFSKPTQRILLKSPKTNIFEKNHTFEVNESFSSKLFRVKVQTVAIKADSEPEKLDPQREVEIDRKNEIEASIVRIMKARKKVGHASLMAEVTEQCKGRFVPKLNQVKERIESLIDRDFLARSESDREMYHYVA